MGDGVVELGFLVVGLLLVVLEPLEEGEGALIILQRLAVHALVEQLITLLSQLVIRQEPRATLYSSHLLIILAIEK